jgi:hypothetical protein
MRDNKQTLKTLQEMENLSFDREFDLSVRELVGYNSDSNSLVRLATDENGQVKIDPTNLDDRYLGINFEYFLDNAVSDVSPYYKLSSSEGATSNLDISGNNVGFITGSGEPNFTIHQGLMRIHFHAAVNATVGRKNSTITFEIYKYNAGVETLITTTEPSSVLTDTVGSYSLHADNPEDWEIVSGDRLLIKPIVTLTGSGTNPTTTLYMEGTYDSSIGISTQLTALDERYLRLSVLSEANATDLTDGGNTTLHTHDSKQDALVSGTNIKTINSTSLLGSGDIAITVTPAYATKSADYNVASTDEVLVLTGSANKTFTLPSAATVGAGKKYTFKNNSTAILTIATTSSQTIDGDTTYLIRTTYSGITVISDGSNWQVIGSF